MILNATAQALQTTMTGGTALTALLSGGTASIYDTQAPNDAAYPYVVHSHQAGGPENITSADLENNLWFVRAYSKANMSGAQAIVSQFDVLLHRINISISGGSTIWCAREENLQTVENLPNDEKVFMAGAFYRIRTTGI